MDDDADDSYELMTTSRVTMRRTISKCRQIFFYCQKERQAKLTQKTMRELPANGMAFDAVAPSRRRRLTDCLLTCQLSCSFGVHLPD